MGGNGSSRYDPAGIQFSGRRCSSLFHQEPFKQRPKLQEAIGAHYLAEPGAHFAWHGCDVDLLAHTALDASKVSLPSYLKWRDFPGPRSVEAKAIAAQGKACRCSSGS